MEMLFSPRHVFDKTQADRGDGSMIALKLTLQAFHESKPYLVFSHGSLSKNALLLQYNSIVSNDPLSSAIGLKKAGAPEVLVFAGDICSEKDLPSLCRVQENIKYFCLNNAGSAINDYRGGLEKQLARKVSAKYSATASVAFPEDFARKLLRMKKEQGLCFLEVHCPSPRLWGFDPSNTVEVARTAVNCGIWPLAEFSPAHAFTYTPEQPEPAEAYARIQSRFSESDIALMRDRIAENSNLVNR